MDAWGAGGRTWVRAHGEFSVQWGWGVVWQVGHCRTDGAATEGRAGQTGKSALAGGTGGSGLDEMLGEAVGQRSGRQCEDKAGCPREVSRAERGRRPWGRARLGALKVATLLVQRGREPCTHSGCAPWGWSLRKGWLFSCDFRGRGAFYSKERSSCFS